MKMRKCAYIGIIVALISVLTIPTGCKTAKFELSSLEISPDKVAAGDAADVMVDLANIGTADGTYTVTLSIDGVVVDTKNVNVPAGTTLKVPFVVVRETVGVYTVGIGNLSGELNVVKPTELGKQDTLLGIISDVEGDANFDFIDIVNVELRLEGGEVVAEIQLAEIPKQLTYNQAPETYQDYFWGIYFDIDDNQNTGSYYEEGADYCLQVHHAHPPGADVLMNTLIDECQKGVFELEEGGRSWQISSASADVNYATSILIIRGDIPGLNVNSRWRARTAHWDLDSMRTWNDSAPNTGYISLEEVVDSQQGGTTDYGASDTSPDVGIEVGNLAPDFKLRDLNGEYLSLSDLRGSPVILNFWATWCGPCRIEMPHLQQIYEEWQDRGLVLLSINLRETSDDVAEFMQTNNLSFPVLLDTDGSVAEEYRVTGIPPTFFIDIDGIIQASRVGSFPSKEAIEEHLSSIIP